MQGPKTPRGGGQIRRSGYGNYAVEEKSYGLPDPI